MNSLDVQQRIAEGPVATIYGGLYDGESVALKVFPSKFDRRTLTEFERERSLLATAPRAPILPVLGVHSLPDDRQALRMELCPWSLAAVVREDGPLPWLKAAELGCSLARALTAAHAVGVVHGAVNPNNILFRESGQAVLADFGMAPRLAFTRDPLRGIEFLAPESVRTDDRDERGDIYGLGAVLHFALTGRAPHQGRLGEQPGERVLRVLCSPVPAIERLDVPVELSTVVARLLAADPEDRPDAVAPVAYLLAGMLPEWPREEESSNTVGTFDDFADADTAAGLDEPDVRPDPDEPSTVDSSGVESPPGEPVGERFNPKRTYLLIAGMVLTGLVIISIVLFTGSTPGELATTPHPPPSAASEPATGAATIQLELDAPTDLGNQVVLNWNTPIPNLDFAVLVSPDGEQTRVLFADRNHTMRIPVDLSRKYCFRIQATDKLQVYESNARPFRGALCRP